MEKVEMRRLCEQHMHRYVELHAADGRRFDGIVEYVDDHTVCLAVPGAYPDPRTYDPGTHPDSRAFFPGPFFPGPFFPGPFFPGPFFRPRRFIRFGFPLAGLLGLSLLPYYW